jgi:hypothetical protein
MPLSEVLLETERSDKMEIRGMHLDGLVVCDHGGGCCGMRHLYEFEDPSDFPSRTTLAEKLQYIQNGVTRALDRQGQNLSNGEFYRSMAIEIVLAEYQWSFWDTAVRRAGFKRVLEFLNSNSGNRCRIYVGEFKR